MVIIIWWSIKVSTIDSLSVCLSSLTGHQRFFTIIYETSWANSSNILYTCREKSWLCKYHTGEFSITIHDLVSLYNSVIFCSFIMQQKHNYINITWRLLIFCFRRCWNSSVSNHRVDRLFIVMKRGNSQNTRNI